MSISILDLYRVISVRCPNLGIQTFTRVACDLQLVGDTHNISDISQLTLYQVPFFPDFPRLFSQSFDVFMEILSRISVTLDSLTLESPNELYAHACPACVYKLDGEETLDHSMLLCMDGNESVKRMRRVRRIGEESNKKDPKVRVVERYDDRTRGAAYFLEASEVDEFAHEVKARPKKKLAASQSVVATVSENKTFQYVHFFTLNLESTDD